MSSTAAVPTARVSQFVALATLLGLAGNGACLSLHTCIAGHLHHPPYTALDYTLDAAWAVLLFLAAWLAPNTAIPHPRRFALLAFLLIPLRFFSTQLGRFSGLLILLAEVFSILALLYLAAVAFRLLWRTLRDAPAR